MKKLYNTSVLFTAFRWKKQIQNLSATLGLLLLSHGLIAQNTSYRINAIPITGLGNTAFGVNAFVSNTTGNYNSATGIESLFSNTTGGANVANGYNALHFNTVGSRNNATGMYALYRNTNGSENIANGAFALFTNTTGSNNIALGEAALYSNTTGINNTATGNSSLYANTTARNNTATGFYALHWNTTGENNTANGSMALFNSTTGSNNTAIGFRALYLNTTGYYNTAVGYQALNSNTTGYYNTACGYEVLYANTTGALNTANGFQALRNNITGNYNTASGLNALYSNTSGLNNTAVGNYALFQNTTGNYNTALGNGAGPNAGAYTNSIAIGFLATTTASNQVRIGNSSITSIGGYQAWTNVSDERVKKDIQEKVPGLEFINKLRPVTYHLDVNVIADFLKTPDDQRVRSAETAQSEMLHTGLIAQEVEKAATDIGYEFSGVDKPKNKEDLYGLRYAEFTIPLIKAVQELSKQNEEQKKQNEAIKKELNELKAIIKNGAASGIVNPIESEQTMLFQNTPNPFNQSTSINYFIASNAKKAVLIIISDKGEKMKEFDLTNSNRSSVEINPGDLAAGVYVYTLIVDEKVIDSKKMILTQ